jgi:hypothetical protein
MKIGMPNIFLALLFSGVATFAHGQQNTEEMNQSKLPLLTDGHLFHKVPIRNPPQPYKKYPEVVSAYKANGGVASKE